MTTVLPSLVALAVITFGLASLAHPATADTPVPNVAGMVGCLIIAVAYGQPGATPMETTLAVGGAIMAALNGAFALAWKARP